MSNRKNKIQQLIKILFTRYSKGISGKNERELVEKIYDSIDLGKPETNQDLERIKNEIKFSIDHKISKKKSSSVFRKLYYPSAAAILICLAFGYYIFRTSKEITNILDNPTVHHLETTLKSPTISLNDKNFYNLKITTPPGTKYQVIDDEKVLDLTALTSNETSKSIKIINPCKEPISVLLNDGSQVWLNFNSSLEFEYDIQKNHRLANIIGEVFFDVKKITNNDASVPFEVKTRLQTIEVLGTKFNVNTTSPDEENVELLEGSIRLSHNVSKIKTLLIPGQKAFLKDNSNKILITNSNSEEKAKAWRKGLFYFDSESLQAIGKELSLWYETPVIISPEIKSLKITAMIKRSEKIEKVLELIELTNNVKSNTMNGKIYINKKY